jgi:hypothetical protein
MTSQEIAAPHGQATGDWRLPIFGGDPDFLIAATLAFAGDSGPAPEVCLVAGNPA